MKSCFIIIFLFLTCGCVLAQDDSTVAEQPAEYAFRLVLADKGGTTFTLEHPEEYLSAKALERRRRQGLAVDSTDLPVSGEYLKEIARRDVEILGTSKWNNTVLVKGSHLQTLLRLGRLPFVKEVVKVWATPTEEMPRPHREDFHTVFNAWDSVPDKHYGVAQEQMAAIGGVRLHDAGFRGRGMTIAVFDAGFMNADRLPALDSVRVMGVRDFVNPGGNVFRESEHGTKVLSTMALDIPNVFVGTAPEASYWLIRCEHDGPENLIEEDYWAMAAEFADSVGVDIVNSSLGFHNFDDRSANIKYRDLDGMTSLISRTASMMASKGMILVNSAGNDGMGAWKKIGVPADARDILTVGAMTLTESNAAFSSVGPTADGRVKPDVMAVGSPAAVLTARGTLLRDTGTSFSAPQIAGMVACLWQAFPDKTALEVMEMVRQSGNNYLTPDNIYGYGVPNFGKLLDERGELQDEKDDSQGEIVEPLNSEQETIQ